MALLLHFKFKAFNFFSHIELYVPSFFHFPNTLLDVIKVLIYKISAIEVISGYLTTIIILCE